MKMTPRLYDYNGLNVYINDTTELYHSKVRLPAEFNHKCGEDTLDVYVEKAIERLPEYIQTLINDNIFEWLIKHTRMQDIDADCQRSCEIHLEISINQNLGEARIELGYKYMSAAFYDKRYVAISDVKVVI